MTETFVTAPRVCVLGSYTHPEGVAAGLARVSRSAEPIDALVTQASEDADLARQRNERIIFSYGHSSVAEHACFSVAISDIPRSLSLDLVSHRLASYTQLSYRYVDLPPEGVRYFLPAEYHDPRQTALLRAACDHAREAYSSLCPTLIAHQQAQAPDLKEDVARRQATEDARYVLPCAQTTQLGMTANARTWGHVISRLRGHPLSEAQALGEHLFAALHPLAPSLFPDKHLGPDTYAPAVSAAVRMACGRTVLPTGPGLPVTLLDYDPLGENRVARALVAQAWSHPVVTLADPGTTRSALCASYRGLRAHDRLPRAFELAHYTFDVVLSEVALHQLVRHRLATIIPEPRVLRAPLVPPQITDAGQEETYKTALWVAQGAYTALGGDGRAACALAGAHARRALVDVSARELCEMSRLRCDEGAQWEIHACVSAMAAAAARVHPTIGHAFGGRKAFKRGELDICRMI